MLSSSHRSRSFRHTLTLACAVVGLAALTACNRDEAPESLASDTAASTTKTPAANRPAPAGGGAPAPAGGGATKTPAGGGGATPAGGGAAPAGGAGGGGTTTPPASNQVSMDDPDAAELNAARRLYTVQVASFTDINNAQSMQQRMSRIGIPIWTTTSIVGGQQWSRTRIGVTTSLADAEALAARIRGLYNWQTWIQNLDDRSALPPGMLTLTRDWMAATSQQF